MLLRSPPFTGRAEQHPYAPSMTKDSQNSIVQQESDRLPAGKPWGNLAPKGKMMRQHLTIVTLGLTAITTPGEARSVGSSDASIIALVQAFSDARSHFDPKALDALLTPDYVEVSPRGEIDRRQAVLGFYDADKATPAPPMSLATQDVSRYGPLVDIRGSNMMSRCSAAC